ncbi:hypothetical protein LG290_11455 [Halomonas sediminis]|uniref:Uncharacterized protein n=1 Tax=Vreelandella zhuhanensis TaxID=2684210 RepID=A0A7X3GZS7_9GAMM|nr:hypothetical protein [Halomonas zhuhanensis]MWJ27724.1 hypothetical protein [Halomonas zhuhanensis]
MVLSFATLTTRLIIGDMQKLIVSEDYKMDGEIGFKVAELALFELWPVQLQFRVTQRRQYGELESIHSA